MKKFASIAKKTGLNPKEINRFSKFSVLSIIVLLITAVVGCVKNCNVEKPSSENMSLEEIKEPVNEVKPEEKEKNGEIEIDEADDSLPFPEHEYGPYPGYPSGTKYFTVAIKDFALRG